jgi:hypothetical protein
MSSSDLNSLTKLAELLFYKSGFADALSAIANDVEEKIAGEYEPIDDEEDDPMTPSYGGLCYTSHSIMSDGEIDIAIKRCLTEDQVKLLKILSEENEIDISVCRDDWFKHEYSFTFSVPKSPNVTTSERFNIYYDIKFSIHNTRNVEIKVTTDDYVEDVDIEKTLLIYTLSY